MKTLEELEKQEAEDRAADRRFEAYLLAATFMAPMCQFIKWGKAQEIRQAQTDASFAAMQRAAEWFYERLYGCPMERMP